MQISSRMSEMFNILYALAKPVSLMAEDFNAVRSARVGRF